MHGYGQLLENMAHYISYLVAEPNKLTEAPAIFGKRGLKIGYGPGKTELILP